MDNEKHSIGPWTVINGSMYNERCSRMLDEDIAILVSIDSHDGIGTFHKIGKAEDINKRLLEVTTKLIIQGYEDLASEWKMIKFNVKNDEFNFAPEGYNLNIDEVCTLINWFTNCSALNFKEFFSLDLDSAKQKLNNLSKIGY